MATLRWIRTVNSDERMPSLRASTHEAIWVEAHEIAPNNIKTAKPSFLMHTLVKLLENLTEECPAWYESDRMRTEILQGPNERKWEWFLRTIFVPVAAPWLRYIAAP